MVSRKTHQRRYLRYLLGWRYMAMMGHFYIVGS